MEDASALTVENIDRRMQPMLHFCKGQSAYRLFRGSNVVEKSMVTDYRKRKVYVLTNHWSTHDEGRKY